MIRQSPNKSIELKTWKGFESDDGNDNDSDMENQMIPNKKFVVTKYCSDIREPRECDQLFWITTLDGKEYCFG